MFLFPRLPSDIELPLYWNTSPLTNIPQSFVAFLLTLSLAFSIFFFNAHSSPWPKKTYQSSWGIGLRPSPLTLTFFLSRWSHLCAWPKVPLYACRWVTILFLSTSKNSTLNPIPYVQLLTRHLHLSVSKTPQTELFQNEGHGTFLIMFVEWMLKKWQYRRKILSM